MRVLVACEFSGVVRRAFKSRGHDAWSCDLLPAEDGCSKHLQCDARYVIGDGWDLMIAHPPCTYLAVSGMHWTTRGFRDPELTEQALDFVRLLMGAPVPRIAIENPVSVISTRIRKPNQTIQPWQFGHDETKATCLWLKNLPRLVPSHTRNGDMFSESAPEHLNDRVHKLPPGPDRWKERSRTYQGIADAMALQWGG